MERKDEKLNASNTASSRRKRLWTLLFILLNIAVLTWTAWSEFARKSGAEKFRNIQIRWFFLLPACLCCAVAIFSEVAKYVLVTKKLCGFVNWKLARRTVLLGRYYDNITPSAVGGQPFQIYYLKRHGVETGAATAISLAGFLVKHFSFVLVVLPVLLFGAVTRLGSTMLAFAWLGTVVYILFPLLLLMFTFIPTVSDRLARGLIALLAKLHLIRHKDRTAERSLGIVEGYSNCVRLLVREKSLYAPITLLGLLYHASVFSIPYFVILAFGGSIGFPVAFCTTVLIHAAVIVIPTPGNSGAAEGVFYSAFSVLTAGYVFWAMLFWRFLIYYIYILFGLIIYLRQHFQTGKKVPEKTCPPS